MMNLTPEQQESLKAAIQDGLPIAPRPYAVLSDRLGIPEDAILQQLQCWLEEGYIKRMGLVVRHHAVGYRANAMVVWSVPDEQVDAVAEKMRQHPAVTLCYRRPRRPPEWQYNLFCMIHGKDRALVLQQIDAMVAQHQWQQIPRAVLFSYRQFKQTGGRYAKLG